MAGFTQSAWFKDFIKFRLMITPIVIQVLFWLGIAGCVITALVSFGQAQVLPGIVILILGPLFVRIYCELLIIIFRIHDLLKDIRDKK